MSFSSEGTTIQVLYTCDQCGLTDIAVDVRTRSTEDVLVWMEQVMAYAIARDHDVRSPHCIITKFTQVKIPLPAGTAKLGGAVEH